MTSADDIPTAHTPPGGYGSRMPAPVLGKCTQPIVVAANYDDGVLVLRPKGIPGVAVRRRRDGEQLV